MPQSAHAARRVSSSGRPRVAAAEAEEQYLFHSKRKVSSDHNEVSEFVTPIVEPKGLRYIITGLRESERKNVEVRVAARCLEPTRKQTVGAVMYAPKG